MTFTKMHGLGNDFLVVAGSDSIPEEQWSSLAVETCDRHFGAGADGLIFVRPSAHADFRMRHFNPDGSEADLCGNGIRCFAKYVHDAGLTRETAFVVETASGLCPVSVETGRGCVRSVTVDMGCPDFRRGRVPMTGPPEAEALEETLVVNGSPVAVTGVRVGNPHCVVLVEDVAAVSLRELGRALETHPVFPRKANVEFAQVLDRRALRMRVWERGVGETQACGSGACASVAAMARRGLLERSAAVRLDGGELFIRWAEDDHLYMTGPATTVYTGEYLAARRPEPALALG